MIEPMDFLLDSEKRYQGAVSGRFIVLATSGTILAIGVLISLYLTMKYFYLKSEIQTLTARSDTLRPRAERVQRMQQQTGHLRRLQDELVGWGDGRPEWGRVLRQIQQATPENVQFLQMDIRDSLTAPRPPGEAVPKPRRTVRVRISGFVEDAQADAVVSGFIHALRLIGPPGRGRDFSAVTLLNIQAETTGPRPTSRFEIEATGPERLLK